MDKLLDKHLRIVWDASQIEELTSTQSIKIEDEKLLLKIRGYYRNEEELFQATITEDSREYIEEMLELQNLSKKELTAEVEKLTHSKEWYVDVDAKEIKVVKKKE